MGFLQPIVNNTIECWLCNGVMRNVPDYILKRAACISCHHCGATIWIWPKEAVIDAMKDEPPAEVPS